jgi:hypothetical protein
MIKICLCILIILYLYLIYVRCVWERYWNCEIFQLIGSYMGDGQMKIGDEMLYYRFKIAISREIENRWESCLFEKTPTTKRGRSQSRKASV